MTDGNTMETSRWKCWHNLIYSCANGVAAIITLYTWAPLDKLLVSNHLNQGLVVSIAINYKGVCLVKREVGQALKIILLVTYTNSAKQSTEMPLVNCFLSCKAQISPFLHLQCTSMCATATSSKRLFHASLIRHFLEIKQLWFIISNRSSLLYNRETKSQCSESGLKETLQQPSLFLQSDFCMPWF